MNECFIHFSDATNCKINYISFSFGISFSFSFLCSVVGRHIVLSFSLPVVVLRFFFNFIWYFNALCFSATFLYSLAFFLVAVALVDSCIVSTFHHSQSRIQIYDGIIMYRREKERKKFIGRREKICALYSTIYIERFMCSRWQNTCRPLTTIIIIKL